MKKKRKLTALVGSILAVLMVACAVVWIVSRRRVFAEIRIESHPSGGGMATRTVEADRTITGGHFSGNMGPGPSDTDAKITRRDMSKLRSLVAALAAKESTRNQVRPQSARGHLLVVITFPDGSNSTFFCKKGQNFSAKEARAIWDIVCSYKVGGW